MGERKQVFSIKQGFNEEGAEFIKVICTDGSEVMDTDHGNGSSFPKINIQVHLAPEADKNPPYLIKTDAEGKRYTLTVPHRIHELLKKFRYWSQSGAMEVLETLTQKR